MSFGQTIKTYFLGLSALALTLGIASCDRTNEPQLQQVQLINVQLDAFALTAKDNSALSAVNFSITNTPSVGVVENKQPLPYGVRLDGVQLKVVPAATAAKVEVAIGEQGDFADWSADKEYHIPNDVSVLRLRLSFATEQGVRYEYSYRVQLRRYRFDPETIEWSDVAAAGLPQSAPDAYMYAQPRAEDRLIIRSSSQGNEYYSHKGDRFTPVVLSGLASGERIVQATSYEYKPYIYTSLGKLYQLEGAAWQEIVTGAEVKALLGVLAPRQTNLQPRLALIVQQGGSEVFASYADGKLSSRSLPVPATFPRHSLYSFGANKTYVGGSLTLVGEYLGGDLPVQSTWYTTGLAEDWIEVSQEARPDRKGARPSTVFLLGDMLYRLETVGGLSLYTSADLGRSWKKNGDKALPAGASRFAAADILGYPAPDHTIQLLHAVSSDGGAMSLLRGRPKKYDL